MERADGSQKLFNDSRLGLLANFAVVTLGSMLVEWLGTLDFSTWPTRFSAIAIFLAGALANAITAWLAPRRKAAKV